MSDTLSPAVVILATDLFFSVRIADVVRQVGARPVVVSDAAALQTAVDAWPDLVLIDLAAAQGWDAVVRRARRQPETKNLFIVAFGSHVDTEALKAARAAGCDHAWARSRFMAELPQLVHQALHPPVRWVTGWDEPPPPLLAQGVAQFNAGEYWACHETLETLWRAEFRPVRDLYQGLLQIGVAFYHLQRGNTAGAIKVFRRGLPRLRDLPEECQGVAVAALLRAARAIYEQVLACPPDRVAELSQMTLPQIGLQDIASRSAI